MLLVLKKGVESFQIVDGPDAGRKFLRGRRYKDDQVPASVRSKFAKVEKPTASHKTGDDKPQFKHLSLGILTGHGQPQDRR